jgi:hypothetical protein
MVLWRHCLAVSNQVGRVGDWPLRCNRARASRIDVQPSARLNSPDASQALYKLPQATR